MAAKHAGRSTRRFRALAANLKTKRRGCCRCGQPIDYSLENPDPGSFSVDHYPHPLSTHPHLAEDPGNLDAAHLRCNESAGKSNPKPGLGVPSRSW